MSHVSVGVSEHLYVAGGSAKYWRAFTSLRHPMLVATHYGRIGTDGQVTVHHFDYAYTANEKTETLIRSKWRKGYVESNTFTFEMPHGLLTHASSTNSTGRGGNSPAAARSLIAYMHAAARQHGYILEGNDPMGDWIATATDAYKIGLAAHANITATPQVLDFDVDYLEALAGLSVANFADLA